MSNAGRITMEEEPEVRITKSDLIEAMRTLGEELRKPSKEDAEKKADAEARQKKHKDAIIAAELMARQQQMALQAQCSHMKENGKYSTGGQMMNDGMATLICSQCARNWRFAVPPETRRLIENGDVVLAEMKPPQEMAA